MKEKLGFFVILLLLIHISSHFLPFERSSISPDDYVAVERARNIPTLGKILTAIRYPDRPLSDFVLMFQFKLCDDNENAGLWLVFLSSLAVTFAAFFLLRELFSDNFTAFIATAIFCLLPQKLETFHTPIFFNTNSVIFLYILSLLLFLRHIKTARKLYLVLSVSTYAIGVFWYEVGFFLPLLMLFYIFLFKQGGWKKILPFFYIMLLYALYRITHGFGFFLTGFSSRELNLKMLPANTLDLIHHYIGRYAIRNLLYGCYRFFLLPLHWFLSLIVLDFILLSIIFSFFKKKKIALLSGRLLFFAAAIFAVFVFPILLNDKGGVAGRHLALPSLGICILVTWILGLNKRFQKIITVIFLSFLFIVSQGNSRSQVIACRINGSVYKYLRENKTQLKQAENIIINVKSFADNIHFTLMQRDFNLLNTYFGAQAFEDWGLKGMVNLVSGEKKNTYIAVTEPTETGENLEFSIAQDAGYRQKTRENVVLKSGDSLVIGFNDVFPFGFNNGKFYKRKNAQSN